MGKLEKMETTVEEKRREGVVEVGLALGDRQPACHPETRADPVWPRLLLGCCPWGPCPRLGRGEDSALSAIKTQTLLMQTPPFKETTFMPREKLKATFRQKHVSWKAGPSKRSLGPDPHRQSIAAP